VDKTWAALVVAIIGLVFNAVGMVVLMVKGGRWTGKVDTRLENQDKRLDEHAAEIAALQSMRFRR